VQTHPDDAIALLDPVRRRASPARNSLGGIQRWDANAGAIGRVGPAMVGADQVAGLDPSQGEWCAAVYAQILERDDPILDPEDDDRLVEHARSHRLLAELAAGRHRMPVLSQDRVRHGPPPRATPRDRAGARALAPRRFGPDEPTR